MTTILLIEDELPARKKLRRFIEELDANIDIVAELDTVESAVEWLSAQQADLIFSDIELLDGNAFDIYSRVSVDAPIIFTTAYDQFWMDAFEKNGIDYLLKPFSRERFHKVWNKYLTLRKQASDAHSPLTQLAKFIAEHRQKTTYKTRFTISSGSTIYFLSTADILFIEADEGVIAAYDGQGKKHLLTASTLKEMELLLDPADFFRVNRSQLLHKIHIEKIERYTKNVLAIQLKGYTTTLKTSQSQTAAFREWVAL